MKSPTVIPATPMVRLYEESHAKGVGRKKRLALARGFVEVPGALAALFADSVDRFQDYKPVDPYFWDMRDPVDGGDTVTKTHHFAERLRKAGSTTVSPDGGGSAVSVPSGVSSVGASELGFFYVDRELVPSRTTKECVRTDTAVKLDLMLRNAGENDATAVVGELKIGSEVALEELPDGEPETAPKTKKQVDKDPFAALVQVMACATQLLSVAQYERLQNHAKDKASAGGFAPMAEKPRLDLYILLHNVPDATFIPELLAETEALSALLLGDARVSQHIRRIACLRTTLVNDTIVATRSFAFEGQPPPKVL